MKINIQFDFIWIPKSLGGHSTEPYQGMRTTIRWQKYLNEFLQCARDITWESLVYDSVTFQGRAICSLTSEDHLPDAWLQEGELIELLSGFRVLAIGRLVNIS